MPKLIYDIRIMDVSTINDKETAQKLLTNFEAQRVVDLREEVNNYIRVNKLMAESDKVRAKAIFSPDN